jgi:hypothetical protein
MSDPVTDLGQLLKEAGVRAYFDRGNDATRPCTFCGTRPEPGTGHDTRRIGTYPNGDPIRRPVCSQCTPVVEAREKAAPLPQLPENLCPDCRLPRVPADEPWDEGTHCPKSLRIRGDMFGEAVAERDCLRIGLDKARVTEQRMIKTLRSTREALDAALVEQGAERG